MNTAQNAQTASPKVPPLIRAMVARGRTISIPTGRVVVGTRENGDPIYGPVLKSFKELSEVELPESEVIRLRQSGHLVDPNVSEVERGEGARVTEQLKAFAGR